MFPIISCKFSCYFKTHMISYKVFNISDVTFPENLLMCLSHITVWIVNIFPLCQHISDIALFGMLIRILITGGSL